MRHFIFFACLLIVVSAFTIVRAEDEIFFDDRDNNSTQVHEVFLGNKNVSVTTTVSGNKTLKIEFPSIGNFSATYSDAGSDLDNYADPDTTKPEGATFKGASFFITLFYPNGSQVEGFAFDEPIIVTISVDGVSNNDKLYLYDTVKMEWTDAAATCAVPTTTVVDGNLQVSICHLTQFAVYEVVAKANIDSKTHNTSGLIAAVIVIPIIIVAVIIALVAWTLLRKPAKRSRRDRDVEMKQAKSEPEFDDLESESSEEETPKPMPKEEKNIQPDIKLKKEESDSETDSSSDSDEKPVTKKPVKDDSEDTDTDTDTDTDSDE